jgi:malonyl-CoA O-methyltransferase
MPTALKRRARAANTYHQGDALEAELRIRILERLSWLSLEPGLILDVMSATGQLAAEMQDLFPRATVIAADPAWPMSRSVAKGHAGILPLTCDPGALPFAEGSMDLLIANLALPWSPEPHRLLADWARVLKPQGTLLCATFGPDSFKELRAAWAEVGGKPVGNGFPDMHHLGDAMLALGLRDPVVYAERLQFLYDTAERLWADLTSPGLSALLAPAHSAGLHNNAALRQLKQHVAHSARDGGFSVTIEAVFGYARGAPMPRLRPVDTHHSPELG